MELRRLGNTGLDVFPIGLGTVKLGRDAGLKYAAPPRIPTDDEALALLRAARDLGVNLIDTAPAYGTSEERLGELLYRVAPRGQWVICTKVGEEFDAATAASRYDFSPAHIRASIHRSLRRLKTDHLDIALLHFASSTNLDERTLSGRADTPPTDPLHAEALATLRDLHEQGVVGAVGASTGTVAGGMLAAALCHVVMVTVNAFDHSQYPVITEAHRSSCGVLIKKPLASGRADPRTLKPILAAPGVASAIIGTTNPTNLKAAVEALS
ncbi:MAG TPA: aldo/keto reductase [Phycisphaerales bacterium]|nr:aldo/keto reductase [Phycisphaerales bacterium]